MAAAGLVVLVLLAMAVIAVPASAGRIRGVAPSPGETTDRVLYRPPVDVAVVDPFRAPTHFAGPGNRGLEYRPAPGTAVGAAADGRVVFAGPVGGDLHVTVLHADGVRTSYSFVAQIVVATGDTVTRGQTLAVSGSVLHMGARVGDDYIDPASLFDPVRARLVGVASAPGPSGEGPGEAVAASPGPAARPDAVNAVLVQILELFAQWGDRLPRWSR
jgi:murein DD-endopeptidase MepM/ murein hydrolase activator NlpD